MADNARKVTTFKNELEEYITSLKGKADEIAELGQDPTEYILNALKNMQMAAQTLGPEAQKVVQDAVTTFSYGGSKNNIFNLAESMADAQLAQARKQHETAEKQKQEEANKPHGYQGWENTYADMFGKRDENGKPVTTKTVRETVYKRDSNGDLIKDDKGRPIKETVEHKVPKFDPSKDFAANNIIKPAIATGADAVGDTVTNIGNTIAAQHSILGNAMRAIHNTNIVNDLYANAKAAAQENYNNRRAAQENVNAAIINGITGAIGNTMHSVGNVLRQNAAAHQSASEQARSATLMKNDQPTGDFYRNQMQTRRFAREDSK